MVLWEGDFLSSDNYNSVQCAGLCSHDMLQVCKEVINSIIHKHNLGSAVKIGVGVTFGSVIVTKIGVDKFYDVKAFGNCINMASHYANDVEDKVKGNTDKFLCCATLPRKITIEKDNKR